MKSEPMTRAQLNELRGRLDLNWKLRSDGAMVAENNGFLLSCYRSSEIPGEWVFCGVGPRLGFSAKTGSSPLDAATNWVHSIWVRLPGHEWPGVRVALKLVD